MCNKFCSRWNQQGENTVYEYMGINNGFTIRTTEELLAEGWTTAKIAWKKHKGEIFSVFRGVYADTPPTPEVVAHALLKLRPGVVFEKRTALELYTGKPLTLPLQARVPSGALRVSASEAVELRRSRLKVFHTCKGLPVASPAELVNSLLPNDPSTPAAQELYQVMEQHYAGKDGMKSLEKDLKYLGGGCKTRIRDFVQHKVVVGVDSPPEADLIRALRAEGFKATPQYQLGKYRWDVGIKGLKVVIDVDSKKYHMNDEKAFVVDRWKANSGMLRGWIALRVTATCVRMHLAELLNLLKELRRLKQKSPRKFPRIDVTPVWQWHNYYTRDWEYQHDYDDFTYT